MRNTCEGVDESQAITWFAQGCRHGTMLWQRLQREMPTSLAETIRVADMYALGDPSQPTLDSVEPSRRQSRNQGPRRGDRPDYGYKRREYRPDYRYGSNQVAAVTQDQPDAGTSQRQKPNDSPTFGQNQEAATQRNNQRKPWEAKPILTYEAMLDGPCSFHTIDARRPDRKSTRLNSSHITRSRMPSSA